MQTRPITAIKIGNRHRKGLGDLDPLCGVGSIPIAAVRNKRRFVGIEIDPEYVRIAKTRMRSLVPGVER